MKMKVRKEKKVKPLIVLAVTIALAVVIELFFGIFAFVNSDLVVLSDVVSPSQLSGGSCSVLNNACDEPHYIEDLFVNGFTMNDITIIVQGKSLNDFGVQEDFYVTSSMFKGDSDILIPIREKMCSYSVIVLADTDSFYIRKIIEQNRYHFNPCRFLLIFVSVLLIGMLIITKNVKQNILLFYIVASLGFGSVMIMATGVRYSTWDETSHFNAVYQLASSDDDWSVAAWKLLNNDLPAHSSLDELKREEKYVDDLGTTHRYTIKRNNMVPSYTRIAYLPMAAVMKTCTAMGLSFVHTYKIVKFCNLFIFTLMLALAIYISKSRKMFISLISLMPTVLFQGCMITYDGFIYCFLTLGIVLIANEIENPFERLNINNIVLAIILIVVGVSSKAIYIPLLLLLLFIPKDKFINKKAHIVFNVGVFFILLVVMSTFVQPMLVNTISGNMSYGGDPRGGETSAVKQVYSMLKHPLSTVKLYVSNIFGFDNYRNMGAERYDHFIFPNLMLLNLGRYGVAADKWSMLLIPILLVLFFYDDDEGTFVYSKSHKIAISVIIFAIVGMIWSALYLSFSTIGNTVISGVQARYYLPILLPTSYVLFSKHVKLNIKPTVVWNLLFLFIAFFEVHLIYNLIILETVL